MGLGIDGSGHLITRHLVVRRPNDLTEDAHHHVIEVLLAQPRQREGVGRVLELGVVHDDVGRRGVGGLGDLESEARPDDAELALSAEGDRLAVRDTDQAIFRAVLAERVEGTVVEDRAVLA